MLPFTLPVVSLSESEDVESQHPRLLTKIKQSPLCLNALDLSVRK